MGIDLGGDGVTANDTGDGDTGPNHLQNFPLITSATSDGVSTSTVGGTLNSTASTTFRLEFFASAACDASGNGEGQLYLGGEDVLTDGSGDVSFSIDLAAGIPEGYVVTGTATGSDGSTSEFSACQAAVVTPPAKEDMDYDWHYEYDPLYRLTYACTDWDAINAVCDGDVFEYTYDAVGNRLTQTINSVTTTYVYDAANRLVSVNGVAYTWDNNGNLTSDGTNTYTYDYANRLVSLTNGVDTYNYAYNGLGDRLQQTVNGVPTIYVLDLNTGLTQVLSDGTDTYLYGLSRIGEEDTTWDYYLGDALGSVRQLTDGSGVVSLAQTFEPYGKVWASVGTGNSSYAFTGDALDHSGLIYLRARYLDPLVGRFINRDTWGGDYNIPLSLNRWMYTSGNPINYTDPSGHMIYTPPEPLPCVDGNCKDVLLSYFPSELQPIIGSYICSEILIFDAAPTGEWTRGEAQSFLVNNLDRLTYYGQLMVDLYQSYRDTPGFWNRDGDFTLLDFFAISVYTETYSIAEANQKYKDLVITTAKNMLLYEGSIDRTIPEVPYRTSMIQFEIALFNTIGALESMQFRIGSVPSEWEKGKYWEFVSNRLKDAIKTYEEIAGVFSPTSTDPIGWANTCMYKKEITFVVGSCEGCFMQQGNIQCGVLEKYQNFLFTNKTQKDDLYKYKENNCP